MAKNHGFPFNRRTAMLSATAGITAMTAASAPAVASCATPKSAVTKTQYGKVRGYIDDGVFTFKGVPYGANTGGENRWLPAKAPARMCQ